METSLKLKNFEGPLDLLLQLIEGEELDITEVSLSQITEQFFGYLDKIEKDRSAKLADFLVVATKLLYLKSKHLLPYLYPEEPDNGPSLADQLKMYKAYVDASVNIAKLWNQEKIAYGRNEPPVKLKEFVLPHNASALDLNSAFVSLLKRLEPSQVLPEVTIDHNVSVKQTIERIWSFIKGCKKFSFKKLLSQARNRTEIIVSFLALLDMIGKKNIIVRQNNSFEEMEIEKI
ncbi:MAG: hypothetical protein COU31_00255 [Candidatus Magasanikbacteria bacterium CG10_big_fil_rev_8_21_14_0_10_40_10]|uniref:Segregation and condensation protein A n=1 Tax=Candidatus Magasanikbacteria bacterium CG10_big_fil_rev_8_21_14_0_10_40_10 TaxID=1974648 RepID=A0A2M6W549_9BACT|nr:MAG: hypothetical protein COU31_00255 [Candidatus Magasanikbacteria bacterium CG10_big_fil_rev_8_21_14_0_10_40_10]